MLLRRCCLWRAPRVVGDGRCAGVGLMDRGRIGFVCRRVGTRSLVSIIRFRGRSDPGGLPIIVGKVNANVIGARTAERAGPDFECKRSVVCRLRMPCGIRLFGFNGNYRCQHTIPLPSGSGKCKGRSAKYLCGSRSPTSIIYAGAGPDLDQVEKQGFDTDKLHFVDQR